MIQRKRHTKSIGIFLLVLSIFLFSISFVSSALTDDLVSYYKMDEETISILDSIGSNDGTVVGATPFQTGKLDYAYDFDGSDDRISMGNVLDFDLTSEPLSISAWIYMDTKTANNEIVSKMKQTAPYTGYELQYDSSGRLTFSTVGTGSITVRKTVSLNTAQWYYIVMTYDGLTNASGVNFYIDGVKQTSLTIADDGLSATNENSYNFLIGAREVTHNPFDGKIDDVRIFDSEISQTNVTTLYNSGSGTETALGGEVALYNLDDSGNYVEDSIKTHHGINHGATLNQTGKIDTAFDFVKANSDYIDTGYSFNDVTDSPFSMAFWVQFDDGQPVADEMIFGAYGHNDNNYYMFHRTTGQINFKYESATNVCQLTGTGVIPNGATGWYHVVWVVNDSLNSFYLNGVFNQSTSMAGCTMSDQNQVEELWFGTLNQLGSVNAPSDTQLDEIGIWNRSLTPAEITEIYNSGTGLSYPFSATGDTTSPTISNIAWLTTGGFTDDTLSYNQVIDIINITATDETALDSCLINVTDADSTLIHTNVLMSNVSSNFYFGTDISLNKAGTWYLNFSCNDSSGNWGTSSDTITVSTASLSLDTNWFGYSNGRILTTAEISNIVPYDFMILEFENDMSSLTSNWTTMITAINDSYNQNIRVGLNYILDYNINDSALNTQAKLNITANMSDLTSARYTETIEYISIEVDTTLYNETWIVSVLNDLAKNITGAVSNEFVVYSKSLNSTDLDNSYIQYTALLYNSGATNVTFIDNEISFFKTYTTLNRIYDGATSGMLLQLQDYYNNVLKVLRSITNLTITLQDKVIGLQNGDIIVFNNGSSASYESVNATNMTAQSGKDVWDSTNKLLIEKDTDLLFSVNVSEYLATILYLEDINHISIDDDSATSTIYKASASSKLEANYTDDGNDGNFGLYGANDILIELYDPHYTPSTFMTYYGWLNVSRLSTDDFCNFEVLILADENNVELDNLIGNCSSTEIYNYISVADYDNTLQAQWFTNKSGEVDDWITLNESSHIFIDGLDSGTGGANFSDSMKELVDYIQVTKGRKVILNTYTAYEEFATWGDGGVMKESCVNRWNGADASNPTSYTREDWDLELNKSLWYNSHNVDVFCQSFGNRTTDNSYVISNYSEMQNIYFASKVLGYTYFYMAQPDFQYEFMEYHYDMGTDLSNSWITDDDETYYRRYEYGIVYYNSSSEQGWFLDGRTINKAEVCFYLYDAHANGVSFVFNVNNVQLSGASYQYSIADGWGVGAWSWQCKEITTPPTNGRYLIEGWVNPKSTMISQGLNIGYSNVVNNSKHSYYDTSTTDSWTAYEMGRNWMVNVSVNETKKTSIDTTSRITQSSSVGTTQTNVTLTANTPFDMEIWSYPVTISDFVNLYFWNGTEGILLNYTNNTDCDTDNPTWNTSTIGGASYKSCIEPSGSDTIIRFASPSISTSDIFYSRTNSYPSVLWSSQSPSDITATNVVVNHANVTYAISDDGGLNLSTVQLYYKTNDSVYDTKYWTNGTPTNGYVAQDYTSNVSSAFKWELDDNAVLPGTYMLPESEFEATPKSTYDLDKNNEYMKMRLYNVRNDTAFNFYEGYFVNQSSSSASLRVYYCNSSYSTGNPNLNDNCIEFYDLPASQGLNHRHTVHSAHVVIPFPINITTGQIGGIEVTNTSYFLLRGITSNNAWDIYYSTNISRTDTIQTTANNGVTWNNFAGTIDSHLHQFNTDTTLFYYACATDNTGLQNCTTTDIKSDVFEAVNLPPTSPNVYAPTNASQVGDIIINYTASETYNVTIDYYYINLVTNEEVFVQNITTNNSLNLSYIFDSSSVATGYYEIEVIAVDNVGDSTSGFSEIFLIDNGGPIISIVNPTGADENADPTNFEIVTDKDAYCYFNLGGENYTMANSDNRTHTYSKSLSDATYITKFYCVDVASNLGTASITFLKRDLSTSKGGTSTGGTSTTTTTPEDNLTLESLEIVTSSSFFFDKANTISIIGYNGNGDKMELKDLVFEILDDVIYNHTEIVRTSNLNYETDVFITNQMIDSITIKVTASDGEIVLTEIKIVSIQKYSFIEDVKVTFNDKVNQVSGAVLENWEKLLFIVIVVILVVFLTLMVKRSD